MTVETPVVLLTYNRPDTTSAVFEQVRNVEPAELFVVADGPNPEVPEDERKCEAVRRIVEDVDWECEVHHLYRDRNHGLPEAVYEGLDWVFDQVPTAIILEDDTVPCLDFFRFCETLLDRYRENDDVMAINGTNRLGSWRPDSADYHFVTYQGVWGWATWRDAWEAYGREMTGWEDEDVRRRIADHLGDRERYRYYRRRFQRSYDGVSPAWSRMWRFAVLANEGLCVVPSRNLVTNVGFDERAVHTTDPTADLAHLRRRELSFPLSHPDCIVPDREYERVCYERFRRPPLRDRIRHLYTPRLLRQFPATLRRAFRMG